MFNSVPGQGIHLVRPNLETSSGLPSTLPSFEDVIHIDTKDLEEHVWNFVVFCVEDTRIQIELFSHRFVNINQGIMDQSEYEKKFLTIINGIRKTKIQELTSDSYMHSSSVGQFIAEHIFSLISSKISEYEGKLDFAKFTTTEDMHREYSRFLEWKESILNEQDKYIKRIKKQIIDDTNKQVDAYLNTKLAS